MTSELTWSEPEVRYWSSYESDVHDGVVMNNDNDDTNNWISKAYYKLNNNKKRFGLMYNIYIIEIKLISRYMT